MVSPTAWLPASVVKSSTEADARSCRSPARTSQRVLIGQSASTNTPTLRRSIDDDVAAPIRVPFIGAVVIGVESRPRKLHELDAFGTPAGLDGGQNVRARGDLVSRDGCPHHRVYRPVVRAAKHRSQLFTSWNLLRDELAWMLAACELLARTERTAHIKSEFGFFTRPGDSDRQFRAATGPAEQRLRHARHNGLPASCRFRKAGIKEQVTAE